MLIGKIQIILWKRPSIPAKASSNKDCKLTMVYRVLRLDQISRSEDQ
jgi:hypothetical protein